MTTTILIITLLSLHFSTSTSQETWIKAGYWFTGSSLPIPNINSGLFTHLICAFAYINASNHELFLFQSDESYVSTFASTVKRNNPTVIPLLSVWTENNRPFSGDYQNSSNFFKMAENSTFRKSFIESSIKKARFYGFEGLDLHVSTLLNTTGNMSNLGTLFDEWRVAIDSELKESTRDQKKLILTMAGYYVPELDSLTYPVDSIRRNFDWVSLRSYDYHTRFTDKFAYNFTAAHTALYDPSSRVNTDYGINEWVKRGLPANKLVLGLAYHGYTWTLVDHNDNGIGAPAKSGSIIGDGSQSYDYIKKYQRSYKIDPVYYNSTYVINYFTFGSSWVGFDDVEAIRAKVSYAKEKGLLGYNVWQVPNDHNWELSKAAAQAKDKPGHYKKMLAITLPAIASVILLLGCIICYRRRRVIIAKVKEMLNRGKSSDHNQQVISFADISEATNCFSEENKLGEGGYGPVYKGKLLNGQEIAVKRLSHSSKQGLEEFKNEVTFAAKLQHVNLVKLLGFCTEKEEKMLIYEYMPNKSLDFYIFDPRRRSMLNWEKWVEIIEGIIQGLLYLQEYSRLTIVHRDLKASNILLDAHMKPRISDFGIAKSFQDNETEASTDHIVGTFGCVPPEYIKEGTYSRKYDVYSFGVLLLQIISGKKNYHVYGPYQNLSLLDYAYVLWKEGSAMEFIDPSLDDTSSTYKLIRCMHVGLLCVEEKWMHRPSMLEVSAMLRNELADVPIPKRPAFSTNKDEDEKKGTEMEEVCSVNIQTISQLLPR
uniref:non-specific serine/threonine protein kinase n=1 Tax=Tanacetum cinerariifolium TaxID=118510 RepID=A0A6L2NID5_TANCI|nr:putative cysteine-rich receptor-like protein kinase 35 [Tanacetum cinerariifolium]